MKLQIIKKSVQKLRYHNLYFRFMYDTNEDTDPVIHMDIEFALDWLYYNY